MAHFAQINENNIVVQVTPGPDNWLTSPDKLPGTWIQTSYNTKGGVHYGEDGQPDDGVALRKNYAGVGYTYDSDRDAFIPPKAFNSWVLNEETCNWEPPVPLPEDDDEKDYQWNESTQSWDATQ
jgi:hypothetical protein